MSSHWRNFGGRYSRVYTNRNYRFDQFQQHSGAQEDIPLPHPSYYQGTSHFQDRLEENAMDQQMDTQEEVPVNNAGTWTTQADEQEPVPHYRHGFAGGRGGRGRHYCQRGTGNVSHRPIWKRRGLGPFRGGFHRGHPHHAGGNVRSIIRRQRYLQKKQEWNRLDHSLRGKGQGLKIDLGSDAAAHLSLDEIITKATDITGRYPDRIMGPVKQNLKIELDSDAAVNVSLGEIISKSQDIKIN